MGLASFLLIGFWYTRPAAVAAAKKAFVVNVIGDFGLMIAIFLIVKYFGTLNYLNLFNQAVPCPYVLQNINKIIAPCVTSPAGAFAINQPTVAVALC